MRKSELPKIHDYSSVLTRYQPSWKDIFPGTEGFHSNNTNSYTPETFYSLLSHLNSTSVTRLLREERPMVGRDVPESWLSELGLNMSDVADAPLVDLAQSSPTVRQGTHRLPYGFVGTQLYHWIEQHAMCRMTFREDGFFILFLGDSTVRGLAEKLRDLFFPRCKEQQSDFRPVPFATHQTTAVANKTYYHNRAFQVEYEAKDYELPNKAQHSLIVANFDGLHALSLYPKRNFSKMGNGKLLFHNFLDFVQHQLEMIHNIPIRESKNVVTLNLNSIQHQLFGGKYGPATQQCMNDPEAYGRECAQGWNESASNCIDSCFANRGTKYVGDILQSIVPVDVDVNEMTRNAEHLTADAIHYGPLQPLKLVQVFVVYILQRIEEYCIEQEAKENRI